MIPWFPLFQHILTCSINSLCSQLVTSTIVEKKQHKDEVTRIPQYLIPIPMFFSRVTGDRWNRNLLASYLLS